ncbi:MAG: ABC transporter substrate-binding protein [Deltaproteobacteria bacterium]|nr:ABC transporter substrate-binding protein [Deltaproteobacteria bacterium]
MNFLKPPILILLLAIFLTPVGIFASISEKPPSIPFGTIPVLQALPLFVASEKGFFKEQGLNVEIVLFNSAMEKDIALTSGRIAGYFGDLMTPMVLQANNTGIRITATNFNTTREQRMFAVLAAPQSTNKGLEEMAKAGIATSTNTISEYLITRLLQQGKISKDKINFIDVKNIPIRLQMLLSNQVPAALLPEPLASLAETKGAKSLLDDKGRGLSATVLAFSEKFLKSHPQAVKSFQTAVDKASDYINKNPQEVRAIMNRECKIPEPFRDVFPIPKFPRLAAPSQKQVADVYNWLQEKKIITKNLTYKDMVADGYLP